MQQNTEQQNVTVTYLFGIHPVMEAIAAGRQIEKVLFRENHEGPQFRELLAVVTQENIPFSFVPSQKLDSLSKGGRHQGVVAMIAPIEYVGLDVLISKAKFAEENPIFILLDGVSDVRNLGAIARSAECAGASGIIVPAKGGAAINSEGIKASAGALLRMGVSKVQNLKIAALMLKEEGFKVIAASEKTDNFIYNVDMTGPIAIVMGAEGKGVSKTMLALSDELAAIPMAGEISSLNVGVAASVVLYEAVRQRITAE
ncbi:MAG: 23S rRNA (guanosine(2251)-2'-O)-methyltransferase RlmB [Bacteroidales bacterium]|nr:23S rRNA (guanosine(2251)-2'-O)-methyltransferase RlmB [Bacteroidales bacterium]